MIAATLYKTLLFYPTETILWLFEGFASTFEKAALQFQQVTNNGALDTFTLIHNSGAPRPCEAVIEVLV